MSTHKQSAKWLYEILPYIYVSGGVATTTAVHHWMAVLSSLLLVAAGLVVLYKRRLYRNKAAVLLSEHFHGSTLVQKPAVQEQVTLVPLEWRSSFYFPNALIDKQHRQLFAKSNELIQAVLTNRQEHVIVQILDKLLDDLLHHLAKEEGVMVTLHFPQMDEHKQIHRSLFTRAMEYREAYRNGNLPLVELVKFVTHKVVAGHILEDLKWPIPGG